MPRHTSKLRPSARPQLRAIERDRERQIRRARRERADARKAKSC